MTVFDEAKRSMGTNYNPLILPVWRPNMDIQFIGNSYSAAHYVPSYAGKGEKNIVELFPMTFQYQALANCLIGFRYISVRCFLLGIKLVKKSRAVVHLNVSHPPKRAQILITRSNASSH